MCSKMMSGVRVLAIVVISTLAGAGVLLAQATTRVSVDSQGGQGNSSSERPAISADGRLVAFASYADNLVPADTNQSPDIFVYDRQTGEIERVSVDSQGGQANDNSLWPAISGDGRFVAFVSSATNLVAGDTNGWADIFVHDRQTGDTTRMSVDSHGGQANMDSSLSAITADGWLVAFESGASNLVQGDTNENWDVFMHDRRTGETTRVNVDSQGQQANSQGITPALSADGRFVAFSSDASNLVPGDTNGAQDVFVHDRLTGETTRVSVDSQGGQANTWSEYPAVSGGGRFVVFDSDANNLVVGDTNGQTDVFVHDRQTRETTRVNVDSYGAQANGSSWEAHPGISEDGRLVAFSSDARNLVPGETNGWPDIFAHDRQTGETTRVSVDSAGGQSDGPSLFNSPVSADGRFVAFGSGASNLVPGDTNGEWDVFVHDRAPGLCTFPASWTNYGYGWPGTNGVPHLVATTDPVLCTAVSVTADNSAGVDTRGFLVAGLSSANLWTAWGGTLLLLPAMAISVGVPAAGLSLTAPIPCDDSLCGLALFAQLVEIMVIPGASRGVSFTPGLELRLGVQ